MICSWLRTCTLLLVVSFPRQATAWFGGGGNKVLLRDVQVLTLYAGKMTNGRRSSPVPHLECVSGGTAPCSAFKPRVVQCTNRGSDGIDVQWECKTDMDDNIRFGSIDVSCEGYDYPDDPYILAGSCGLRYNLDYTGEGYHRQHTHDYGYESQDSYGWREDVTYGSHEHQRGSKWFRGLADLIVYCALGLMIWAFYKTCISPSRRHLGDRAESTTNDDYPAGGGGPGYGWNVGGGGGGYQRGPGYNQGYDFDASCRNRGAGPGAGGFWTGAAAGGLLGYMLGGNRGGGYYNQNRGGWFGSGYNGGWGGGGFRSSSRSGSSSGTRTASGFGGTSRR